MYNKNRKEQVLELWNTGLSSNQIAEKLGISASNISVYLTKSLGKGYKRRFVRIKRKYTFNEHFFDTIDMESKAYFLGLICADGYLSKKDNIVSLGLQERDKYILEIFNKSINYNRELCFVKKVKEEGWNRKDQYKIQFCSSLFKRSLEKYNLTPTKSLTLEFPQNIPNEFLSHFIRGYFDGDGCIHIGKEYNKAEISIACSKSFGDSLSKLLNSYNISTRNRLNSAGNCYYCRIAGGNNIEIFYNLLYSNSVIFLERKKEIFNRWINERVRRQNIKSSKRENKQ